MNRNGKKLDWDNDDLEDLKVVDEQPTLTHPGIISRIPGVETEDMYDGIMGPLLIDKEEKPPSYAERAAKVRNNTGLDTINQVQGGNKKHDEVIFIDDDNNDVNGNLV